MLARELACAAVGWALAIATWIGASRLQRSLLSDEFGADGLPRGLAIGLALTATLIAARALWRHHRSRVTADDEGLGLAREHLRALGIVALGFGYILLAPFVGYVPAAILLIVATAWYYGARLTPTLAVVAIAGAIVLWWVFAKMLSVSMPVGFWGRLLG